MAASVPRMVARLAETSATRSVTQAILVEGRHRVRVHEPGGAPPPGFERVTATLDTQLRKPVSVTYRTGLGIPIADFPINTICLHEQFDTDLLSVWVPHAGR